MYINWIKILKIPFIIILVIVAYFLFDSLNLMPKFMSLKKASKHKIEITDCPAVLEEIRQIGELVTASYYGEVYADLLEVYQDSIEKYGDSIAAYPARIYSEMPGFSSYFAAKNKSEFKRNLIYIGRGNVKMGIEFSDLDLSGLKITDGEDSVVLCLPPVRLLNADINPWYIENKVFGYEIFKEESAGTRFTDAEIKAVKQLCKKKLQQEAIAMGLMERSAENAGTVIHALFQLFTEKELIVECHANK